MYRILTEVQIKKLIEFRSCRIIVIFHKYVLEELFGLFAFYGDHLYQQ